MQYALPPPPHYALCTLAEGLEVASGKPCCRSFAELSAKTAEGNRCWQGSCAPIGGDEPELKFDPKHARTPVAHHTLKIGRGHAWVPIQRGPVCRQRNIMLYTIAVVLIILWLLGLVTSYTMGGVIHVLLVIALVMVLVNFISGRRR